MKRTKYILRGVLFLVIVLLIVYMNSKGDSIGRITKFKIDTFNKIKSDSLNQEHKLDTLVNDATKFTGQIMEDSPRFREGLRYVIGVIGLWIVMELGFYIAKRRTEPGNT